MVNIITGMLVGTKAMIFKSFSETINIDINNCVNTQNSFVEYPTLLTASLMHKYPPEVGKQLQVLKFLKKAELRCLESGEKLKDIVSNTGELLVRANNPNKAIDKARQVIKSYQRGLVLERTGGMASSIRRELKRILDLDFNNIEAVGKNIITKIPEGEAAKIAESVARQAIKKTGVRMSAKLLAKYTAEFIPWVVSGIIIKELIDRAVDFIKENTLESNTIPHGDFYHKDVGWY